MSMGIRILIGAFAALVIGIVAIVSVYGSTVNSAVTAEAGIKAAHENSRNVLGQHAPKITEAIGVTKVQKQAVEDIITASNESRYGSEGSGAVMQWIQEQNPNLDQTSYARIVGMIEAGRNDFQLAQKDKIDRLRAYEVAVKSFPNSFFYSFAGYPSEGFLEKYSVIVASGHANDAFTTGIDNGIAIQ